MPSRTPLSQESVTDIITRYLSRECISTIAQHVGVKPGVVRRVLTENKIPKVEPILGISLVGSVYGKLTVIGEEKTGHSWRCQCQCECGNLLSMGRPHLVSKGRLACHTCQPLKKGRNENHPRKQHLVGRQFHDLKVVKGLGGGQWECLCTCGRTREVSTSNLNAGHIKSCNPCARKRGFKHPHGVASRNALYASYTKAAQERNYGFSLTKEEFTEITSKDCFYCGVAPAQMKRNKSVGYQFNGDYIYNGIDRRDNSLGYTKENSVPCCGMCNRAKDILSEQDYRFWIQRSHDQILANSQSRIHSMRYSPLIISLSGYAGCGKDTFSRLLIEELVKARATASRIAFADVLKQQCRQRILDEHDIDILTASREEKDRVRHVLVETGEARRRETHGTFWVNLMSNALEDDILSQYDYRILTDLRYDEYGAGDELGWVRSRHGVVVTIEKYFDEPTGIRFLGPPNESERVNTPKIKAQSDWIVVWKDGDTEDNLRSKVTEFIQYLKYTDRFIKPKRVQGEKIRKLRLDIASQSADT